MSTGKFQGEIGSDDADRLLHDDDALRARALLGRGQHLARVAQHVLGGAAEVVGRVLHHLLARLADRLADLAGDHLRDLLGPIHADRERVAAESRPGRAPTSSATSRNASAAAATA